MRSHEGEIGCVPPSSGARAGPPSRRAGAGAGASSRRGGALVAAAMALAAFFVARPVLGLFFAQDDFVLLERARFHPWRAIAMFFTHGEGMFRPVSKGLYFVAVDRVLAGSATAAHAAGFLVHLGCGALVARLARRLGLSREAALGAAAWVLFSAVAFEALAWVSCIQQLLATLLALAAVERSWAGLVASRGGSRGALAAAAALWLLAVGSAEQAGFVAAMAGVATWLGRDALGPPARARAARTGACALALSAAWVAWMFAWRSPPDVGPYAPHFDATMARNAWVMLGRAFGFAARPGDVVTVTGWVAWPSHAVALGLVAWNLARGRGRLVALALGWIAAVSLPVLPLREHQMPYHALVASPAAALLAGAALGDVTRAIARWRGAEAARAALGIALVTMAFVAALTWRADARATFRGHEAWPRDFVVRRARIAHNAWRSLERIAPRGTGRTPTRGAGASGSTREPGDRPGTPARVVLVYAVARDSTASAWHRLNVRRALGDGAALRLYFDAPRLDVRFALRPPAGASRGTLVLFHDDLGHLRRRP